MAQKNLFELEICIESKSEYMDFDEPDCSEMTCRCALHEGVQIEIEEKPTTMAQLVKIIIAMQKFKTHHKVQSTMFTEHEVFNIFMDSVVEESVANVVCCDASKTYNKQDNVMECTVCDKLQKSLVKSTIAPVLQAVTLKGGNLHRRVLFHLSSYTPPRCSDLRGQPVCLGIAKSKLYLSCTNVSGNPTLSIEEINDKDTLKTISANNDMDRFLFLRRGTGNSVNTFESVKYPGWFISTSQADHERVDMCVENDASRLKVFTLYDKTVVFDN
ncbi:hypothetical protein P4O66_006042 [Electrophorus voltai]|uniref:Interleukin-1 n=1 Tax=Electrophorus voltai TaxID=2609070 RepID=A0AAD9E1K7_9TELE|nr:hypothetical protein P4O66_006042 [Electrophorus voltai]